MTVSTRILAFLLALISSSTNALEVTPERYDESSDEELESTQPYNNESEDEIPSFLTPLEVNEDLMSPQSVRYNVASFLRAHGIIEQDLLTLLTHHIICIGTGKNRAVLHFKQFRPTYVREQDFTIDLKAQIGPDLIADAFSIHDGQLPWDCGVVFFAHVGFGNLSSDKKTLDTLKIYINHLVPGGYFIYVSEIPVDSSYIAKAYKQFHMQWISHLQAAGCQNITVFIKDETEYYAPHAQSLVVIGKKGA